LRPPGPLVSTVNFWKNFRHCDHLKLSRWAGNGDITCRAFCKQ
jgi:hypothetical protein